MAASDTKQVQTMVNVAGQQIEIIREAITLMEDTGVLYSAAGPDATGTAFQGKENALSGAIVAIRSQADSPIWDDMVVAIVPSHRNKALG